MTENAFSANDVFDFLKRTIEIGGIHQVNADCGVWNVVNNEPVGIQIHKGKDGVKQIALYKENLPVCPEFQFLNPFTEVVGNFPEKDWYFGFLKVLPGCLMRVMIRQIAEVALSDQKDTDYATADLMAPFTGRIDKTFLKELDNDYLRPTMLSVIYYDRTKQTAQLQSCLWDDDYEKKVKGKIRTSSLKLVREMVLNFLDKVKPEKIYYTAQLVGCPTFDAIIHVLLETLDHIGDKFEKLTGKELGLKELHNHAEHLEAYHKAMQWLSSSAASPMKEKKDNTKLSAANYGGQSVFNANTTGNVATPQFVASGTTNTIPVGSNIIPNPTGGMFSAPAPAAINAAPRLCAVTTPTPRPMFGGPSGGTPFGTPAFGTPTPTPFGFGMQQPMFNTMPSMPMAF